MFTHGTVVGHFSIIDDGIVLSIHGVRQRAFIRITHPRTYGLSRRRRALRSIPNEIKRQELLELADSSILSVPGACFLHPNTRRASVP